MLEFKELVEDHREPIRVVEGVVGAIALEKVARAVIDVVPARAGLERIHSATVDFGEVTELLGPHTSKDEIVRGVVHHKGPIVPADPGAAVKLLEKAKKELHGAGVKSAEERADLVIKDIVAQRQRGASDFGQQIDDTVKISTSLGDRAAELGHVRNAQYGLAAEGAAIALAIPLALAGIKKTLEGRKRRRSPEYQPGWIARKAYDLFNPAFTRQAPVEQPQRELVERV